MRPDVALGKRAQNGVDQRMQRDVGIGMPGQGAIMRNPNAAEPNMVAWSERMHVITRRRADIGKRRR
jgi:hypothetical protein